MAQDTPCSVLPEERPSYKLPTGVLFLEKGNCRQELPNMLVETLPRAKAPLTAGLFCFIAFSYIFGVTNSFLISPLNTQKISFRFFSYPHCKLSHL